ncbi:MAG: type II/IV secretion system protein [Planctomycetes bacterium]|nr:type II/IV secretion system protein [Planctomycetota bacterium]
MPTNATLLREPPSPSAAPTRPGQLFIADDFALADMPPTEIWDRVISIAVREQASDVHLTFQADGTHVGLRLDGRMCPQGTLPAELGQRLVNHAKVLANLDVSERRRPQDGHLTTEIDGRPIDLRLSVFPTNHGEDLAVRLQDREVGMLEMEQLGIGERQLRDLAMLIDSPSGLILVTGPTGAGKTTTLYALLQRLAADGSRKIATIEDPIEYDLPGINQSQVNTKIGVDYATLVRSVLRQDPNAIMIGEIRDPETADIVVRAANSGRLVLATSHAIHSGAAIESLVQLGAHPHFVARAFRGAIAQTLVRRLCPYCTVRLEETADIGLLDDVRHLLGKNEHPVLSMGRGCPHCRHTGYRGRVGVFEVLVADDETRSMIGRGVPARQVYDYAVKRNMITVSQAGKLAALRGLTTVEELFQNVSEIWTGNTP